MRFLHTADWHVGKHLVFPLWAGRNVLARDRRLSGFAITPDESYASVASMRIVTVGAPGAGQGVPR